MPPCLPEGNQPELRPVRQGDTKSEDESAVAAPLFKPKTLGKTSSNVVHRHDPMFKEALSRKLTLVSFPIFFALLALLPSRVSFILSLLVALDAAVYYTRRGSMAGVPYTLPFVSLLAVVIRPVQFWDEQANLAVHSPDGMSCNTLLGGFMVYLTDTKLCRQVLTGEGIYQLYVHPNALWLLGDNNLVYMKTEPHKRFRKLLSPALFSTGALSLYAEAHEQVARKFLSMMSHKCDGGKKAVDVRLEFRNMAVAASQESFLGPYLSDEVRSFLEQEILTFMMGFLCFPFPYLNTGLAKAIVARKRILKYLESFAAKAREKALSHEPRCLLEHWEHAICLEAKEHGVDPQSIEGSSDKEVASSVLDFLFAAQDATNSALSFAVDVLASRPDIVGRVRDEVDKALSSDPDATVSSKMNDGSSLPYTKRVVNQLLHHKPPVPMIPHKALRDVRLGGYFLPKGTIVIPSLVEAARTSGMSKVFDPETSEPDVQFVKTITFGAGQHKCAGRRYAERLLGIFVVILVTEFDFERVGERPDTLDIMYFPTLFPAVNNFVFTVRKG